MKKISFVGYLCLLLLVASSCNKAIDALIEKKVNSSASSSNSSSYSGFTQFTIKAGYHYADQNVPKSIETGEMKFAVVFDSSAMYKTLTEINQYDINKLYGFSDNNGDHHQYSARFGWRWSDGALRLFAYVYNAGVMVENEITTISIGKEMVCSIKIIPGFYVFSAGEKTISLPRSSTTTMAKGYQLYPYFGGDETAPHDIRIWIKNL